MGSSSSKYMPDGEISGVKALAPYKTYFYGRMTPGSPDGKDLGLSEPAPTWDFPKTNGKDICIIRPQWKQGKFLGMSSGDWNMEAFDSEYQPMLGAAGITEDAFNRTIQGMNNVLASFAPFTSDQDLYIAELRKYLTKANKEFPRTRWELQVHKYATELSPVLFFENVYHSVKVTLLDATPSGDQTTKVESPEKAESLETETQTETETDTQK